MFLKLFKLEFKGLFRSPQFLASVLSKIMISFVMIYFSFILIGGAFALYYASIEEGQDPVKLFSKYFIVYLAFDLLVKYFMQQMPTQNIKPLLCQNISKNTIVGHTIFKIAASFLSWAFLLFIIPFTVLLVIDSDYSTVGVLCLVVSSILLVFNNVLINIVINKNNLFLYSVLGVIALATLAQYFGYFDFLGASETVFMAIYNQKFWLPMLVVVFIFNAQFVFKLIKRNLYLDKGLEMKKAVGKTENIAFLQRFGKMGIFIGNDIRMIKRSKMARSAVLGSLFFLFYGFLMFSPGYNNDFMKIFMGLFVTGGFMFTFGQRVPAWDSSYYPFMMTQNIPYKGYLKAKWSLSVFAIGVAILFSLIYAFVSWELFFTIFAAGLYNLGVNSYMTLFAGAYNKKAIDLNSTKKAFAGGSNNFNLKIMLLLIPQMLLPMVVFSSVKYFFSITPAVITLGALGLIGFLLRDKIFELIVKVYKTEKYSTIAAFKQD